MENQDKDLKDYEAVSETGIADFMDYYTDEKVAELRDVFDRVCDPVNWKNPIRKWIWEEDFEITREAIMFFTATAPTIKKREPRPHSRMVYIEAPGYYAGPAN